MKQLVFEFLGLSSEATLKLDPKSEVDLAEVMAVAILAVIPGRVEGSDEDSAVHKQDHA